MKTEGRTWWNPFSIRQISSDCSANGYSLPETGAFKFFSILCRCRGAIQELSTPPT